MMKSIEEIDHLIQTAQVGDIAVSMRVLHICEAMLEHISALKAVAHKPVPVVEPRDIFAAAAFQSILTHLYSRSSPIPSEVINKMALDAYLFADHMMTVKNQKETR